MNTERIHFTNRGNSQAGFGAIETVLILGVTAIVTTVAVIAFSQGRADYELRHRAQSMVWQIERARSMAIKLNRTLTLGFTGENQVFGLTCNDCPEATAELPPLTLDGDLKLSHYPTLTIGGTGTIESSTDAVTISDGQSRRINLFIANSGRVSVSTVYRIDSTEGTVRDVAE